MLSWFRTPYRLGYGDSGNRMMASAVPFVCSFCLVILHELLEKAQSRLSAGAISLRKWCNKTCLVC